MTPRSCLDEDSELKLLTSRCEITSVQSLPQSVRLLQSKLKAERLALAQLRLEVKDVMKMSEDCRAHHHDIQLRVMHLSLTQLRSNQLVRLFGGATWPGLVPYEVFSVLYILLMQQPTLSNFGPVPLGFADLPYVAVLDTIPPAVITCPKSHSSE